MNADVLKLNLILAAIYRIAGKAANAGGLTSCFLAEALRTQRKINKTYRFYKNTCHLCVLSASARVNI
jgi:hypothetical protein